MHPDQDVDPTPPRSSRFLLFLLVAAAAILLFVSLVRQRDLGHHGNVPGAIGKQLSAVQFDPLVNADQSIDLGALRGKVALINIWGPWCGPCLMELPELLELEKKYRGHSSAQVLLVAFPPPGDPDDDLREATQKVMQRHSGDAPVFYEPGRTLPQMVAKITRSDGFAFPTTLLLDKSGTIRAVWTGYDARSVHQMGQGIEEVLAEG